MMHRRNGEPVGVARDRSLASAAHRDASEQAGGVRPRRPRRRGRDDAGTMSLEIVLLMPVLMLLALFVLWAGRAGRAVLMVDLVAEEAATAAALGCEKGLDDACEDLVDGIVSARPGLGFLCVGGVRPGPDRERMVDQEWVSLAVGEQPPPGEISAAGLFGVSFQCETDGAVAPLRGLFPTVTFLGQASEVAMQLGPPRVSISDVEVWEGEPLEFVLSLSTPPVTDVTLDYSVRAATPHTYGGMCETGGSSDVAPPTGPDVTGSDVAGSDVDLLFVGSDVDLLFVGSVTIIEDRTRRPSRFRPARMTSTRPTRPSCSSSRSGRLLQRGRLLQ